LARVVSDGEVVPNIVTKVYLEPAGRIHSLLAEMVDCPPEGYEFVLQPWGGAVGAILRNDFFYYPVALTLRRMVPLHLLKPYLERFFRRPPPGTALTYAYGHPIFRSEPWVLDVEWVTQLAGFSGSHLLRWKGLIEKTLASVHCRRVLCWTEATRSGLLRNLDCRLFERKLEVVPRAVRPKRFAKAPTQEKARLLFLGSANIRWEFENKGGREVLAAFEILSLKYDNLELVVRAYVPPEAKAKYGGFSNIKIIDHVIPREMLEQEFRTADIFVLPAYHTPGMAFLEAMSYELPVVTIGALANGEIVRDGETGIVVPYTDRPEYYVGNGAPNPDIVRVLNRSGPDRTAVEGLVTAISTLIEDAELRRAMGRAGRWEIEHGKFSIASRNAKLKRIFDEAIGDGQGSA
jgi:glycosyltransferase involved in cell wall biosynthesis